MISNVKVQYCWKEARCLPSLLSLVAKELERCVGYGENDLEALKQQHDRLVDIVGALLQRLVERGIFTGEDVKEVMNRRNYLSNTGDIESIEFE